MYYLNQFRKFLKKEFFVYRWRKNNKHNETLPVNFFPAEKVSVGRGTYGALNVLYYGSENERLEVGNYCSIAPNVIFNLGGEHNYKHISNYPFYKKVYKLGVDAFSRGPIIVCDDVWIGAGCTILSGVTLGKGCVVGAGSVVSKDIPPYAVFARGEIVRYRFPESIRKKISDIDFSSFDPMDKKEFKNYCHMPVTEENVDNIIHSMMT